MRWKFSVLLMLGLFTSSLATIGMAQDRAVLDPKNRRGNFISNRPEIR